LLTAAGSYTSVAALVEKSAVLAEISGRHGVYNKEKNDGLKPVATKSKIVEWLRLFSAVGGGNDAPSRLCAGSSL
jgi:hypothetical protein